MIRNTMIRINPRILSSCLRYTQLPAACEGKKKFASYPGTV